MLRRVASDNALLLAQYAASALVPLLLVPHIVRAIGLEAFGGLAVAAAAGGYGATVVQYAFQLTGPVRLARLREGESPRGVFVEIFAARGLLLLLTVPVFAVAGAAWLGGEEASVPGWILLIGMPVAAGLNAAWFLQARGRFGVAAAAAITGSLVTLAVGWAAVEPGDAASVTAAAAALALGPLVAGVITVTCVIITLPRETTSARIRPRAALVEGWPLFLSQIASAAYMLSGPIVISRFADLESAGAFSAVERFVNGLAGACLLTHVAAYPRLAALYQGERLAYARLMKQVLTAYLAVALSLAALGWLFREPIQGFIFGAYSGRHEPILFWGLASLVVAIFGPAFSGYLTVSGQAHRVLPVTLAILGCCAVVGPPAVMSFGAAGWLAAIVLAQCAVLLIAFWLWRKPSAR